MCFCLEPGTYSSWKGPHMRLLFWGGAQRDGPSQASPCQVPSLSRLKSGLCSQQMTGWGAAGFSRGPREPTFCSHHFLISVAPSGVMGYAAWETVLSEKRPGPRDFATQLCRGIAFSPTEQ